MIQPTITMSFLKSFNYSLFRESEYQLFSGVTSPAPVIGYNDSDQTLMEFSVIIDGDHFEVYREEFDPDTNCLYNNIYAEGKISELN